MKFFLIQTKASNLSGAYYGPQFIESEQYKQLLAFDGKLVTILNIVKFINLYNKLYTVPFSVKIENNQFMIWIEY